MSSLHQDHLLVEGPETADAAGSPLAPARGTSHRPTGDEVSNRVPAQRQGKAQPSGTTTTAADAPVTAPRAKRSTTTKAAAAGTVAARAKAATACAATSKAASKAATAAKGSAAAKPTPAAKATPATKAAAVKATTVTKPATAKATAKPVSAEPATVAPAPPTAVRRPTPYKRPRVEEAPVLVADSVDTAVVVEATEVVPSLTTGRIARRLRRRPALYLAAALVASLGLAGLSNTGPSAQATDSMGSVSVAHELGLDSTTSDAGIDPAGTERLGELVASRKERDAEQAAAAQVQAQADQAAAAAAAEAARPKAVLPVNGARLTSGFGARWGTLHAGTDFAAPIGTPEYAVMDGVVLKAGPASGFGLAVYIQHENGDVTVYGHMEKILVQTGQVVKAGDTIALLGNRGQSTGPHLHLEVHVGGLNGQKIDPLPWLRERGINV
jgi:murein DD-endopeptidase MepM/ murein hydrolase activator NlpD